MKWQPGKVVSPPEPARAEDAEAGARRDCHGVPGRHRGGQGEALLGRCRGVSRCKAAWRSGRVRQGVCPFHDEAEGSFTAYSDSQRWYCFGCGEGGDVLDFIQRTESVPLSAALQLLDGRGGHCPAKGNARTRVPAASELPARDPALLTAASRFYTGQLLTECRGSRVPEWARDRGCHGNGARPRLRAWRRAPRGAGLRRVRRRARRPLRALHRAWSGTVRWHDRRARWGTWPCPMVGRASHQSRRPAPVSGVDGPQANPRPGSASPTMPAGSS